MNEIHAVTGRGMKLAVAAMVAALASLLAFAPFASAASDPLASGTTTIKINNGLYRKLKKSGVKVLGVSPATVRKGTVTLTVSGGELDPLTGKGFIEHSGGVKLKRGKAVTLRSIVVNTAKRSLSAKLGAKTLKVATLLGVSSKRDGFGVDVSVRKLKLTAKAAKLLNGELGVKAFKANANLGSSSSMTQPSTVTILPGGSATLSPNLATLAKFASKGVNPLTDIKPINGAGVTAGPAFTFPISGGTISPSASGGIVQTTGGLAIEPAGKLKTEFNGLWADFGTKVITAEVNITPSPPGPGNLARSSIADIDMSTATVSSNSSTRTVTVNNFTVRLQAVAAATLNQVYPGGVEFVAGDPLGTVSATVQTQ